MNINVDQPMLRPALMVRAARLGARSYRRKRDLPGAVAGLFGRPEREILPALTSRELQLETMRRLAKPGYRPAQHLQVLAALIAEAQDAGVDLAESAGSAGEGPAFTRTRPAPHSCGAE